MTKTIEVNIYLQYKKINYFNNINYLKIKTENNIEKIK